MGVRGLGLGLSTGPCSSLIVCPLHVGIYDRKQHATQPLQTDPQSLDYNQPCVHPSSSSCKLLLKCILILDSKTSRPSNLSRI